MDWLSRSDTTEISYTLIQQAFEKSSQQEVCSGDHQVIYQKKSGHTWPLQIIHSTIFIHYQSLPLRSSRANLVRVQCCWIWSRPPWKSWKCVTEYLLLSYLTPRRTKCLSACSNANLMKQVYPCKMNALTTRTTSEALSLIHAILRFSTWLESLNCLYMKFSHLLVGERLQLKWLYSEVVQMCSNSILGCTLLPLRITSFIKLMWGTLYILRKYSISMVCRMLLRFNSFTMLLLMK
jgi:hypothetical protein